MINLKLGSTDFLFDIKEYPKKIALLFSGGVESTLLLYLLNQEIQNTDHLLSVYVVDRPNKPIDKSREMFSKISKGSLNVLQIPKVQYWLQVPIASIILKQNHDVVLRGINKYPPDESIRPNHIFSFQETENLRLPFKDLEKTHTIEAFYKLGIEHLLPYTHSCGADLDMPCGKCFNCLERAWAYNTLGLEIDLGC
jgi:7-cyano-7-deazaguanine synthase in queuosine biosynthesis